MYDTDSNDEMSALEKLLKILKNGPKMALIPFCGAKVIVVLNLC